VASPKTSNSPGAPKSPSPSPSPGLTRSLDALTLTNVTERSLLHHFTSEASRITSCHPQIQVDFCQLLIPIALEYPALLSAILALSSIHKTSLYQPQGEPNEIITHKTSSIIKLRSDLSQPNERMRTAALATILTLCMCEIHSGADKPRSWRLHLEGAKALIASISEDANPTSASSLLRRWYTSIEALAAITAKGLPAGQLTPGSASVPDHTESSEQIYLDDYFGFSTDLPAAFKEIGAAAWERRSTLLQRDAFQSLSELDFEKEADCLEATIQAMIDRDQVSPPKFYPGVEGHLSPDTIHEFRLCNEIYQHAALIHIQRRVRLEPKESPLVQRSVKRILGCASQIIPKTGLSPWIVLTMPLFTAGREAIGEDRVIVKDLMIRLYESLKLKNIRRSLDLIESSWANDDDPYRAQIQGNSHNIRANQAS
jgi:hypothetical protein